MIPVSSPYIKDKAKRYVSECLDTNWISSQGKYILKFEKSLAKYHKIKYCVVTSSCTTALNLAIKSLNIGKGDEIICPDLTFIAPANMISLSGAKLRLVDVNPETFTIDHTQIEKKINKKTKAIMVVHQMGHAANMDPIMRIARRHNLKVIEDNAESIGAKYKGRRLGTIGDISTLSFFANKIITTGEGGAILTNSKKIAEKCSILRDHGMSKTKKYLHLDLGFNYRMNELQAALGSSQLKKIKKFNIFRNKVTKNYFKSLKSLPIKLPTIQKENYSTFHLFVINFDEKRIKKSYDQIYKELIKNKIGVNLHYLPVHLQPIFKRFKFKKGDFPVSEKHARTGFSLPIFYKISKKEQEKVVGVLKKVFDEK